MQRDVLFASRSWSDKQAVSQQQQGVKPVLQRTAIIVGAGIAGLSTGCYARMNGWNTRIFEMHERPGGLCTAWSRKGYIFDGCIHHLAGAGPASRYRPIWEELGAADLEMEFPETFVRCEDASGRQFNVYTDLEGWPGTCGRLHRRPGQRILHGPELLQLPPSGYPLIYPRIDSGFYPGMRVCGKDNPIHDQADEHQEQNQLELNR